MSFYLSTSLHLHISILACRYDDGPLDEHAADNTPYNDLERTPRPLRNEDFMGDVTVVKARQQRKFHFVLKKKIFLPKDTYAGDDSKWERLTYIQAEDEVIMQVSMGLGLGSRDMSYSYRGLGPGF